MYLVGGRRNLGLFMKYVWSRGGGGGGGGWLDHDDGERGSPGVMSMWASIMKQRNKD